MYLAASIGDLGTLGPAVVTGIRSLWEGLAQGAGSVMATSIWQGAVIVCGLEIATRMMRRISAAHRFVLWAAGFGVAAGLPLLPLWHFSASAPASASAQTAIAPHALWQIDARWGFAIAALWVLASAIRGTDLLVHSLRLRRLWKTAQPVAVSENLSAASQRVRGGRVLICTTNRLDRPSVIGFFAPRVLIPVWLMGKLTPAELEQIVLHETEHLRRWDDWTNLAQKLVLVAFPLSPGLAWMEHRLCREREMACDEGVVRITQAPRAYAACLASLAERGLERREEALSLGAWQKRSELMHRVQGILRRKNGMSRRAAGALLGVVGCALMATTVEMARAPELIAFVPEQKMPTMTAERLQRMNELLAQESADSKMVLPAGYRAVATKALMPDTAPVSPARHQERKAAMSKAVRTRSTEIAPQVAQAASASDRVNADTSTEQWIVLSAWEEVRTISPANGGDRVADFDSNPQAGVAQGKGTNPVDQGNAKSRNQARSSYTVTQLILRVVPANPASSSTQLSGTVHGGWFVIQL